jgi:pimeloyl-ACP methyl ester carboxylesterase
MTVHEFGKDNKNVVVLIHPALVMWDYFEYVIPLLQEKYRVIVPALPGYDEDKPGDFTSVEEIAAELARWLAAHGIKEIGGIYGCSMGGAIVTRFLADQRIRVRAAVIDGGITPYHLPWIATRCIAVRDFLMIYMGKLGGIKLLEKAFATDDYSEEDLQYVAKVLRFVSAKTVWRTFESCNNYKMPMDFQSGCKTIEYWYAQAEKKARKLDIAYIRNHFPQAVFKAFENVGHGGLAALKPELLVAELERVMGGKEER